MSILKKENWWIWLILTLVTQGISNIALGALLGVFNKDAWYAKWYYWVIGLLAFVFPFFIMLLIFIIQITVLTASKLDVPGKEIYLSPYIWLICIIVPIIGWICMGVMLVYIEIWTIVMLYKGTGERYINLV